MSATTAILSRGNWVRHATGFPQSARINLWMGGIIVTFLAAVGLLAPWIAPYDLNEFDLTTLSAGSGGTHLFGTDGIGRDVLSQVIYATRTDLLVGLLSAICPLLIGAGMGLLPGALGRWIDSLVRLDDVIDLAFPLIVVPVAFIVGPGLVGFVAALSLAGWVSYARLVRMPALKARKLTGIACVIFALSDVIPAVWAFVSLSVLGLGASPPTVEWGFLILMGLHGSSAAWWISGLAFALLILGCSQLAQGLTTRFGLRQS